MKESEKIAVMKALIQEDSKIVLVRGVVLLQEIVLELERINILITDKESDSGRTD